MLSDKQKKMLTEFLGECWHESEEDDRRCIHCQKHLEGWWIKDLKNNDIFIVNSKIEYRTFTSWQDLGDLKEKIVEMWEWDEFIDFTLEEHGSLGPVFSNEAKFYKADYIDWLMNPERFCELVAKWWKERRKGNEQILLY